CGCRRVKRGTVVGYGDNPVVVVVCSRLEAVVNKRRIGGRADDGQGLITSKSVCPSYLIGVRRWKGHGVGFERWHPSHCYLSVARIRNVYRHIRDDRPVGGDRVETNFLRHVTFTAFG